MVLEWCWSGDRPLGYILSDDGALRWEVHAQAICRYPGDNQFYRFSCSRDWSVLQDSLHDTVEEAKQAANSLYGTAISDWHAL